jgi:hypothetical protein
MPLPNVQSQREDTRRGLSQRGRVYAEAAQNVAYRLLRCVEGNTGCQLEQQGK